MNYCAINNCTVSLNGFCLYSTVNCAGLSLLSDLWQRKFDALHKRCVAAFHSCQFTAGVHNVALSIFRLPAQSCWLYGGHIVMRHSGLSQSWSEKWLCQFEWALYVLRQGTSTQCSGNTGERGKQRKRETEEGFYLRVTKSAPTVRQSASEDGKGRGCGGEDCWRNGTVLNGGILPFLRTRTHSNTRGIPPGSTQVK